MMIDDSGPARRDPSAIVDPLAGLVSPRVAARSVALALWLLVLGVPLALGGAHRSTMAGAALGAIAMVLVRQLASRARWL